MIWIPLVLIGIVVAWLIGIYNRLVALRNRFKNAFAQIDVQLKRRYDLIPNLVETAKGYMKHERETLEAVISARNQARSVEQRVAADPGNAAGMRELVAALDARGITIAEAPYWRAYKLSFLSAERITVASTDVVRITEYQRLAEAEGDRLVRIREEPCAGGIQLGGWYLCPFRK